MSYLIACMLCAFAAGIIVGVMAEASARRYFLKRSRERLDNERR